jgi:orotidine-5'-phosphate decarboxylase
MVKIPQGKDRIIVALDTSNVSQAIEWVKLLKGKVGAFKIGYEFILSMFAQLACCQHEMASRQLDMLGELFQLIGADLFIDAKIHDIPNTMAGATKGINLLNPKFINLHASAGLESMAAVVKNKGQALVFAVTVLTSLNQEDTELIYKDNSGNVVCRLAKLAKEAGVDGIICSPHELKILEMYKDFEELLYITPGIRLSDGKADDQKRVTTPYDCVKNGGHYIVVGRPITEADEPEVAVDTIVKEIILAERSLAETYTIDGCEKPYWGGK